MSMHSGRPITLSLITLVVLLAGTGVAVAQEASPVARGVPEETLYTITLPPDALPAWDRVTISLTHFTIPPDTESAWEASSGACCPGPKLKVIVAGTLTVASEGPLQVVRAEKLDTIETVPANTEVVLTAGDTVITRNEQGDRWVNAGPEPVELLSTPVLSGMVPGPPVPRNWIMGSYDVREGLSLPARAYTLQLQRMTMTTGDVLQPPAEGFLFVQTLDGDVPIYLGRASTGAIRLIGAPDTTVTMYVLTVEPAEAGAGTPIAGMGA
jgi:hypothetical protein